LLPHGPRRPDNIRPAVRDSEPYYSPAVPNYGDGEVTPSQFNCRVRIIIAVLKDHIVPTAKKRRVSAT